MKGIVGLKGALGAFGANTHRWTYSTSGTNWWTNGTGLCRWEVNGVIGNNVDNIFRLTKTDTNGVDLSSWIESLRDHIEQEGNNADIMEQPE